MWIYELRPALFQYQPEIPYRNVHRVTRRKAEPARDNLTFAFALACAAAHAGPKSGSSEEPAYEIWFERVSPSKCQNDDLVWRGLTGVESGVIWRYRDIRRYRKGRKRGWFYWDNWLSLGGRARRDWCYICWKRACCCSGGRSRRRTTMTLVSWTSQRLGDVVARSMSSEGEVYKRDSDNPCTHGKRVVCLASRFACCNTLNTESQKDREEHAIISSTKES